MVEFYAEASEIVLPRFLSEGVGSTSRSLTVITVSTACSSTSYLGRPLRGGGIVFLDDYQLPSAKKAARLCITTLHRLLDRNGSRRERWHLRSGDHQHAAAGIRGERCLLR